MTIYRFLKENKLLKLKTIDIELSDDDFIIDEIPFENYFLTSNNNIIVSIKTKLNNELIEEGIARDFVRKIQTYYEVDVSIDGYGLAGAVWYGVGLGFVFGVKFIRIQEIINYFRR